MKRSRIVAAITNGVLVLVLAAVSVVCFLPSASPAVGVDERVVSRGNSETGVSLMFNVYWGTEEVYSLLDILGEHGAKATFFLGGCWADDNVACVKEIVLRGHEVGSHGYFHREHDKLTLSENFQEIRTSAEFLSLAAGQSILLFAPPAGAYSDDTLSAAEALGLKTVLWSRDTVDWRDKDEGLVFSRATEGVKGGELILLHPMPHTVKALPRILTYYETHGLSAVTVGENLQ